MPEMTTVNRNSSASYGVLLQILPGSVLDQVAEQVKNVGHAIVNSGLTVAELKTLSDELDHTRERYIQMHGEARLHSHNELHTVHSALTQGGESFLKLALNENLLAVLKKLISPTFILNQQNSIISPTQETYNQSAWHMDCDISTLSQARRLRSMPCSALMTSPLRIGPHLYYLHRTSPRLSRAPNMWGRMPLGLRPGRAHSFCWTA